MSDLRALAEKIKVLRDQRKALTQERVQLIAQKRSDTQKLLTHFAEIRRHTYKADLQMRINELNAIRARAHTIQTETKGLLKTYAHERQELAKALLSETKALRQKLASDNQTRLAMHQALMKRINEEYQAICNTVRTLTADVQHSLKTYEQTRRDGRTAWHQLLGSQSAQANLTSTTESPFVINIPFAPSQKKQPK